MGAVSLLSTLQDPVKTHTMNTLARAHALADFIDIVDTALATLSRRLPVSVSRDDLASVGKLALIAALTEVQGPADEVRAYSFVRVRGAMLDELRRLDPLPRGRREKFNTVMRAQAELSGRLGRASTRSELSVATNLPIRDVAAALAEAAAQNEVLPESLESMPDTVSRSPAETVETEDLHLNLRGALSRLTSAQAAVLYRYYFDEVTLDVIAAELGVSKERVRQIRESGEKKLRADFVVLALWQTWMDRQ